MINFNKSDEVKSVSLNGRQYVIPENQNEEDEAISVFNTSGKNDINGNEDLYSNNNISADNEFPVNIQNKSNVLNTKYDENGNFYVKYNNNTEEVYAKNEKGNFTLYSRTNETANGTLTQYYDRDGKNVTGIETVNRRFDKNSNQLTVMSNYKSKENNNETHAQYIYEGQEEDIKTLKTVLFNQKYNGKKYESEYTINRDSSSNIISVETREKERNGNILYSRYDGQRGEDVLNAMFDGYPYNGLPNEGIRYDKKGNIQERRIHEIANTGALESVSQYDGNDRLVAQENDFRLDNRFTTAYQGQTGDCYLLAALNSFSQTDKGQEILRNNITETVDENGQKIFTVKFPGAEKAAESLKNNLEPDKVYIKGSYTVSQAELDAANANTNAFSIGDQDILLYELAFNKYRHDVKSTVEENNINPYETNNYSGLEGYINPDDPIDGGFGSEVKFLITGSKPDYWWKPDYNTDKVGLILDNTTHRAKVKRNITVETPLPEPAGNNTNQQQYTTLSGFMQTANASYDDKQKEELIQRIIQDAKDGKLDENIVTIGINVSYPGEKTFGPHEVSVVHITDKEVTIIDSNDRTVGNSRKYTMSLEDFKRSITSLDVLTLK